MYTSRKALAAPIAIAMLALLAAPAAANPNRGTIVPPSYISIHTAGNVGNPNHRIPIPGDGTGPQCNPPLPAPTIDLATAGNNTNGTWSASTPAPPGPIKVLFTSTSGTVYQLDISILTANGTYTTFTPPPLPPGYTHHLRSTGPNHIILQLKFYRLTGSGPFNCQKTDLRCTLNTRVLLQDGSGFNGTLPGASGGETLKWVFTSDTAGGLALTPVGGCDADLSSVNGKHVTGEFYLTFP